uniref:TTKRSYEDQ domain-containing protein n=1 Tax=Angiostrongylus cantonensis TaxID=6313 RepID=A0A0K0DG01_ANGCA
MSVLEEELEDKIRQNMELTGQINELKRKHDEECSSLLSEVARNVEQAESHRFISDRIKEHKPERPIKSVKPLEQSFELSSGLAQCSQLLTSSIDIVEQCILKAEFQTTWCDSQLEELNTAWCAGLCRLLIAMESVCAVLEASSSSFEVGEKLCATLEEGAVVIKATSHCLSRLVSESSKLAARARAVNELVRDSSYSEVEMLKQVNRERLRAVTNDLQTTQSTANYYKGECLILLRKNSICMNEKRILEETVDDMTKEVAALTDELASVRRSYGEQLSQLTEHVADLNGKLADMEREKTEQRYPVAQQRGGVMTLCCFRLNSVCL